MSSFNSDSVGNPTNCFGQHARSSAPGSLKQNEAGEMFLDRVHISSFDAAGPADGVKQTNNFELHGQADAGQQRLGAEDSNGVIKYNSIFSECLFA